MEKKELCKIVIVKNDCYNDLQFFVIYYIPLKMAFDLLFKKEYIFHIIIVEYYIPKLQV